MKVTKFVSLLAMLLALGVAASGCKKNPKGVTMLPEQRGAQVGDMPPTTPYDPTKGINTENPYEQQDPSKTIYTGPEHREVYAADTVHFDYDSSVVKASEKSKIATVADSLKADPTVGVRVEGHCDERGTDGYNDSLGERRAAAVREELINLGIDAHRVMTVSFGRRQPADTGHSDAAHAKNRRCEFVQLTR